MRRRTVIVVLACVNLLVLGGFFYLFFFRHPSVSTMAAFGDPDRVKLPENVKLAKEELRKARSAFRKFKPRSPYIVIDTHSNTIFLRTEDSIIFKASCSRGSGGELVDKETGRHWIFNTPRGIFRVETKIREPWWRKPDWAFIEEEEEIPGDESQRMDPEMLGAYAMGFGQGYYIHGTIYERLLGVSVTHGCVRVGAEDLKRLYNKVDIGTPIYIF